MSERDRKTIRLDSFGFKERNLEKSFLTHRAHARHKDFVTSNIHFALFARNEQGCAFLAKRESCVMVVLLLIALANSLVLHCLLHKTKVSFVHTFKTQTLHLVYKSLVYVTFSVTGSRREFYETFYISHGFSHQFYIFQRSIKLKKEKGLLWCEKITLSPEIKTIFGCHGCQHGCAGVHSV